MVNDTNTDYSEEDKLIDEIASLSDEDFEKKYQEMQLSSLDQNSSTQSEEVTTTTEVNETNDEVKEEIEEKVAEPETNNETITDTKDKTESNKETVDSSEEKTLEEKYTELENKYKELMKPFKANGTTIEIKDPNELISLAQKGINYTQKMQKLNPQLKIVESLRKANLLDENIINTLIDINNGDKEAITAHLKKLNINVYNDIDLEKESSYQPKNHIISDTVYNSEQLIKDINEDQEYGKPFLNHITSWDEQSQIKLSNNSLDLQQLYEHKKSGLFDVVNAEATRQKVLGNFTGMSMLETYATVGKQMQEQGLLNNPNIAPKENKIVDIKPALNKVNKPFNQESTNKIKSLSPVKTVNAQVTAEPDLDALAKLDDSSFLELCKKYNIK
jgi:hypothetical protein